MIIDKYDEQYKPLIKKLNTVKTNLARDKLLAGTPIILKEGIFSKYERNLINDLINEFLEERNLTKDEFQKHVDTTAITYRLVDKRITDFPMSALISFVSCRVDMRTATSIQKYIYEAYDSHTREYTEEDNITLLAEIKSMGTRWKLLNEILKKNCRSLENRYLQLTADISDPNKILNEIRNVKGKNKRVRISEISKKLKTSIINVKTHYNNFLKINFLNSWNETQETFLLLLIMKYNYFTPFEVDIKELYGTFQEDFITESFVNNMITASSKKERGEIINSLIDHKFINKITGASVQVISFDDILFGNIISEWRLILSDQNIHKVHLMPKLTTLLIKHDITTYNDAFTAFKICLKKLIETKIVNKLIEGSSKDFVNEE